MTRLVIVLLVLFSFSIGCDLEEEEESTAKDISAGETSVASQPAATVGTEPTTAQTVQTAIEVAPTDAPTPTSVPEPTHEPLPTLVKINPYPTAPECTDHDETRWHGLWNAEAGCHYDHTHNADPFGTVFAERMMAKDQTISYPWQTPNENEHKHQGYKYAYNVDQDCSKRLAEDDNCVVASLIQLHAVGSQLGITTRFHSFWAVALVSDRPDGEPGLVELGGHSDFGILHCPYKDAHCPLPSDPSNSEFDLMWSHPPYRASSTLDRLQRDLINGQISQAWNSGWQPIVGKYYPEPYNLLFEYDFISLDAWGGVNIEDPTEVNLVCPDGDCPFNHSTLRVYEIVIRIPEELAGADGRVNFNGFTDLQGNINRDCTEAGPECVPLMIENAPVGRATFRLQVSNVPLAAYPDFDIYFNDTTSGWIQYPN